MNFRDKLTDTFRISAVQEKALKKLGVITVRDLLYHFPSRYDSAANVSTISSLHKGESAVIFGNISGLKTRKAFRKSIPIAEAVVKDDTGSVKVVWFHQAYLAKMLTPGTYVRLEGKFSEKGFSNPKIEPASNLFSPNASHALYPIYPESRGVTSNWIYHALKKAMSKTVFDTLIDPIPESVLQTYKLPNLKTALIWIHTPKEPQHAEAARKRFAFEEIFFIQLERQKARREFK